MLGVHRLGTPFLFAIHPFRGSVVLIFACIRHRTLRSVHVQDDYSLKRKRGSKKAESEIESDTDDDIYGDRGDDAPDLPVGAGKGSNLPAEDDSDEDEWDEKAAAEKEKSDHPSDSEGEESANSDGDVAQKRNKKKKRRKGAEGRPRSRKGGVASESKKRARKWTKAVSDMLVRTLRLAFLMVPIVMKFEYLGRGYFMYELVPVRCVRFPPHDYRYSSIHSYTRTRYRKLQ